MVSALSIDKVLRLRNRFQPPLSIIPLHTATKLPAVRWKSVIDGQPFTDDELREFWDRFRGQLNPGIATGRYNAGGTMVVDLDNQQAVAWAGANLPRPDMITITRHGQHWHFRHPGHGPLSNRADVLGSRKRWEWEAKEKLGLDVVVRQHRGQSEAELAAERVRAEEARAIAAEALEMGPIIDIRGDGGQVVAPGAIHPSGFRYMWERPWTQAMLDTLPVFDANWFETARWRRPGSGPMTLDALKAQRVSEKTAAAREAVNEDMKVKRASAWLAQVDPAVSGSGGHNKTFYAACRLITGFDLDVDTAFHLLKDEYNPRCQPPWSDEELAHKVVDAEKQRGQNDGFMLVDREGFGGGEGLHVVNEYVPATAHEDYELDEVLAEAAIDAGGPPPPPDDSGPGGGEEPEPEKKPAPAPVNDEDRAWAKRWAMPFGVDFLADVKGQRPWTPHQTQSGVRQLRPDTNNLAVVLACSRHLRRRYALAYNNLKMHIEVNGERITDAQEVLLKAALDDLFGADIAMERVRGAITLVAMDNAYEPVRDWLLGLPAWDGVPRLNTVPHTILGNAQAQDVHGVMFRHTMIALCARIMKPGTKVDHITFLVGDQGAGKSQFWRLLMDGDLDGSKWFSDSPLDLRDKDSRMVVGTNSLIEWSEGEHAKSAKGIDQVKAFLSAQEDEFRPPYGRNVVRRPRRCIFVGTSNDEELLHDTTGSRRFYILRVGRRVDLDALLAVREQLFAEALAAYQAGERWWFTAEEDAVRAAAVAEFQARSPWHDDIVNWVEERRRAESPEFTIGDVMEACIRMDRDKKKKSIEAQVRHTLTAMGCVFLGQTSIKGRKGRFWAPPPRDEGPDDDLPA